jgi:hypothetical protein
MALGLAILSCALATGTCHPAADPGVTSYAVRVTAPVHSMVRLRAVGVPAGWIASFCTPRVCSPFAVSLNVPAGTASIEISYVRQSGTRALPAPHVAGKVL